MYNSHCGSSCATNQYIRLAKHLGLVHCASHYPYDTQYTALCDGAMRHVTCRSSLKLE